MLSHRPCSKRLSDLQCHLVHHSLHGDEQGEPSGPAVPVKPATRTSVVPVCAAVACTGNAEKCNAAGHRKRKPAMRICRCQRLQGGGRFRIPRRQRRAAQVHPGHVHGLDAGKICSSATDHGVTNADAARDIHFSTRRRLRSKPASSVSCRCPQQQEAALSRAGRKVGCAFLEERLDPFF